MAELPMEPLPEGLIALVESPSEGNATSFTYRDEIGLLSDGFVIRFAGTLYAYRNQCRHQPLTLDYGDGEVFTDDRKLLLCRNHGALFEPQTGLCISGPCTGASLFPLTCEIQSDGKIAVKAPNDLIELE